MSEQYDEQPVDQAQEPADETAAATDEVLTDPETGETVAAPVAGESWSSRRTSTT